MPALVTHQREDGTHLILGWQAETAGPEYRWPLLLVAHNALGHVERDGKCASDPLCVLRFEDDEVTY